MTADGVALARIPFSPRSGASGQMFARVDGDVIGIDELSPFTLLRQLPPRYWGRGIATGDIHNDGRVDLLVAADNLAVKGISLYANRLGKGFVKQRVDVPLLNDLQVVVVSLVDIDGDGWLDMFVSAYRGGNHIIFNREGRFTSLRDIRSRFRTPGPPSLPRPPSAMSIPTATWTSCSGTGPWATSTAFIRVSRRHRGMYCFFRTMANSRRRNWMPIRGKRWRPC